MRRIATVALVLTTAFAATAGAQTPQTLDDPVGVFFVPNPLPPCAIATALLRLEQVAHVLIGFERTQECSQDPNWFPDPGGQTLDNLSGRTVREILDHLIILAPTFEWRDMEGVGVVRPFDAWSDQKNTLNAPVAAFAVTDGQLTDALLPVLQQSKLNVANIDPASMAAKRFSLAFAGGTMVEALNQVVRSHGAAVWDFGAAADPDEPGTRQVRPVELTVRAFDSSGFSIGTSVFQTRSQPPGSN